MMNEIELQGLTNGYGDLAERTRTTRLRLLSGASEAPSSAQRVRLTHAAETAVTELRQLLDQLGGQA